MTQAWEAIEEALLSDEPDYESIAEAAGPEVLPQLFELADHGDVAMAAKATHLASLIRSPESLHVVEIAAHRSEPQVRVAAAAALGNLQEFSLADRRFRLDEAADVGSSTLEELIHDPDPGVRKFARRSAGILDVAEDSNQREIGA